MPWRYYLLLIAAQLAGLFLNLLGLPGLWIMIAALVGFGWITTWNRYVGWPSVITVLALGVIAELLEFFAGSAGAQKAGASRRAMVGAIIGGLVGGFVFSIPLPIIGTIFGVCLGTFLGAAIIEMGVENDTPQSLRVGWGAAKGRFVGIMFKLLVGLIIFVVSAIAAFPI